MFNEYRQYELQPEFETTPGLPGPRVTSLRMRKGSDTSTAVRARILWPALGFPAVISTSKERAAKQNRHCECDATHCICVLVLSNKKVLTKEDASNYLRYVPWADRGTRYTAAARPGSFAETDLDVKRDMQPFPDPKDQHGVTIRFGANCDDEKPITVKLSNYILNFYKKAGLPYLHEIRLYEHASDRLQDGLYHLFWNNDNSKDDAPSSEMKLLLDRFAYPRRKADVIPFLWDKYSKYLLQEYEYEYGALPQHKPYYSLLQMRKTRTEILHPLFVQRSSKPNIKVGHITDTHVDVRADVYEVNLRQARPNASCDPKRVLKPSFNNWNTSFKKTYNSAKGDSDILLLTGDLIDYGRGHWGIEALNQLGEDRLYHSDRNWFLFYYLLASGDAYQKPVYTI